MTIIFLDHKVTRYFFSKLFTSSKNFVLKSHEVAAWLSGCLKRNRYLVVLTSRNSIDSLTLNLDIISVNSLEKTRLHNILLASVFKLKYLLHALASQNSKVRFRSLSKELDISTLPISLWPIYWLGK